MKTPTSSTLSTAGVPVVSTSLADGRRTVLGTIPINRVDPALGLGLSFALTVVGDVLVVPGQSGVTGFRLPAQGRPATPSRAGYAAGDVTADQVVDLCVGVSAQTKRQLGFRYPTLPAPANCGWNEQVRADDNLQVQVSATAFAAAKGTSGRARAEQVAAKGAGGFGFSGFGRGEPVPGLGDEAFVDAHVKGDRVSAQVLVRVDNAIVSAYVAEYVIGDGVPFGLTATIRKGATAVAADAVAELARRR